MPDRRGNSDTDERIEIMEHYIRLFRGETIDCLPADREFAGARWINYPNSNNIRYHIRIRENFYACNPRNGRRLKVSVIFARPKCGECGCLYRIYRVHGELCYLSASKVNDKDGKPELQIIISYSRPENAPEVKRIENF
jgi:hypothetical protein